MPYFTLISRPLRPAGERQEPWAVQFGAHERADVVAERLGMRETDRRNGWRTEYRIIRTASARAALVREVISALTDDLPPPKRRATA